MDVYTNNDGEIFVANRKTSVLMRINATKQGLEFFTTDLVEPTQLNPQTIGWKIIPR